MYKPFIFTLKDEFKVTEHLCLFMPAPPYLINQLINFWLNIWKYLMFTLKFKKLCNLTNIYNFNFFS